MALNFQTIQRNRNKAQYHTVQIPEWGGPVRIRRLGTLARLCLSDHYTESDKTKDGAMADRDAIVTFAIDAIANSVVDDDGQFVFATAEQRAFLHDEDFDILQVLIDCILEFNGMDADAEDPAATEAKKN